MNKLALMLGLCIPVAASAQDLIEPNWVKGVYALHLSNNGKWVGSSAGDASIYNIETGENVYYEGCLLGLGHAVADNGIAVGNLYDVGVLMKDGKTIFPQAFENYWFTDINDITPDASRITGIVNSIGGGDLMYVPFVADLDANGNVGTPVVLPHPRLDFFNATPQFVTAVHISDDGKTIVGQVQDWRGMFSYPIYYKEDEKGVWTYYLPTQEFFNPTGIEIPANPWLSEPPFPEPENFMSGIKKDRYLLDFENYSTNGGPFPFPEDYMSDEQYEVYKKAVEDYNRWYYGQEQNIKDYIRIYSEVLKTTPSFSANDMAIHPSGDYFMMHGGREDENGDTMGSIFKFHTKGGTIESVQAPSPAFFPYQIHKDGTLLITLGQQAVPTTYILLPGTDKFITLQEYFKDSHPEISEWLDTKVPGGTGVVLMNEDKTVITGALTPYQVSDYDWELSDYYYSTYFIDLKSAGVEKLIAEPTDGIYRVFSLQGMKIMETRLKENLNSVPKGLYIINGKKTLIN